MRRPTLDFYYEFASPYSYLVANRVGALAEAAGVLVNWRPILLGPIFAEQGYTASTAQGAPLRGHRLWLDVQNQAVHYGLPDVVQPAGFPADTLLAARVAVLLNDASRPGFSLALFKAAFAKGRDVGDREVVRQVLAGRGHFCADVIRDAETQANKDALAAQTARARHAGVFNAPSFVTADGKVFWGNGQLEPALAHAVHMAEAKVA